LHLSISTGADWERSGWGYKLTQDGLKQFVDPKSKVFGDMKCNGFEAF